MKLLLFCSEIFRCLDMSLCFKCNKNVIDTITVYCKWVEGLNISLLCKPFGNGSQSDFFWCKEMFGLMMENPGNFISFFSIAKSVKIINNSLLMTEKRREHFGLRTSEMCLPPAGEGMVCFVTIQCSLSYFPCLLLLIISYHPKSLSGKCLIVYSRWFSSWCHWMPRQNLNTFPLGGELAFCLVYLHRVHTPPLSSYLGYKNYCLRNVECSSNPYLI